MGKERFVVTGANGFLGTNVFNELAKECEVKGLDVSDNSDRQMVILDITDRQEVLTFIERFRPNFVIHTAAISFPDACEKDPQKAWAVNVEGTRNLAEASKNVGAKLIFTSSLHVFDGKHGNYSEVDDISPINQYGRTKAEAEKEVLNTSSDNIVLRLSTLYGHNPGRKDYVIEALEKFKCGKKEIGLTDVFRNQTLIDDFIPGLLSLLGKNAKGVFHFCNSEISSDYDFVLRIARVFGFPESLVIPQKGKSFYPKNTTLNTDKLRSLGIKFHTVHEGFEIVKRQVEKDVK